MDYISSKTNQLYYLLQEFRLRGYEYGPLYQGILNSTEHGESGQLSWEGDWVSFLDTMLQVRLEDRASTCDVLILISVPIQQKSRVINFL